MSKLFLVAVTNDLNQDQRMHRICTSIVNAGHHVILCGREKPNSSPLLEHTFRQKRIKCLFTKGFLFYLEYNIRLFFYALKMNPDVRYAVDLDTLLGLGSLSFFNNKKLIHDAHEYFVEVPELEGQNIKKMAWNFIGKTFIPRCHLCITVNEELAEILSEKYNNKFVVIKSVPRLLEENATDEKKDDKFTILYQGVLNKGRGIEEAINAICRMDENVVLKIAGEGDISKELRQLVKNQNAGEKVEFLGWLSPHQLKAETDKAQIGLNLLSATSLNYKYSLANKFFDYMHAEIPSINMDFPVYSRICATYKVGVCIPDLKIENIQTAIRELIDNDKLNMIKSECIKAKSAYNWQSESNKLIHEIEKLI